MYMARLNQFELNLVVIYIPVSVWKQDFPLAGLVVFRYQISILCFTPCECSTPTTQAGKQNIDYTLNVTLLSI